jgi:hypothetical protein
MAFELTNGRTVRDQRIRAPIFGARQSNSDSGSCHNPIVRHLPALFVNLLALVAALFISVGVASATATPKNTIILSGDAVGAVRFGEAQSAAAAALVKLIGRSEGGVQNTNQGDCAISASLYWANFAVFFYRGKFDGYQTGNDLTDKPEPTFNGVTPQGLRVGDTLAQAQKLYGSAISTSGVQGGVYAAATKTGTIRGYLSDEPNHTAAPKVKLLTISAGSVGCPAMSPG